MSKDFFTTEQWEKLLNIHTMPSDYEYTDQNHAPYEPTGYGVLKRLSESGLIKKGDKLVDYGCGKGRVAFFLGYVFSLSVTGIEYMASSHMYAQENLKNCALSLPSKKQIRFLHQSAEGYEPTDENLFYFFNPFSPTILSSVLGKIVASYYMNPRPIRLFFYYPSDEYLSLLMTMSPFEYECEIDVSDFETGDKSREKISVFRIQP